MPRLAFLTGAEHNKEDAIGSKFSNGTYTASISTANPRSGSYHLRCSTTDPPSGTGAGWDIGLSTTYSGGYRYQHNNNTTYKFLPNSGTAGGFDLVFSFELSQLADATNLIYIARLGSGSTFPIGILLNTNSAVKTLTLASNAGNTVMYSSLAAATTYNVRIKCTVGTDRKGTVEAWLWDDASPDTLLANASLAFTDTSTSMDRLRIGIIPVINFSSFLEDALDLDIDDIVVKTEVTESDTSTDPGSGKVLGLNVGTTDGAFTDLTPVGSGTHVNNIDEGTASVDTSDYNYTSKTALDEDSYNFTNYGGSGTVLAAGVLFAHDAETGGGVNDVFHIMGFYDTSAAANFGEGSIDVPGIGDTTPIFSGRIIDKQQDGSTALTNTYVNGLEVEFRRRADLSNLNDKDVHWGFVEVYDDTGRTPLVEYTAVVTGTATSSIDEDDIVTGNKTIILTLTGTTWVASGATFNAIRQNIIDNITAASSPANGWNNEVVANQGVAGVGRTSDTVVTVTLDAQAGYDISAQETITVVVPSSAVVDSTDETASPTFTVDPVSGRRIFVTQFAFLLTFWVTMILWTLNN